MGTVFLMSFIILITWLSGCSTKGLRVQEFQVAAGTPDPAKPPEEFYVIGAGDSLNINVDRKSVV